MISTLKTLDKLKNLFLPVIALFICMPSISQAQITVAKSDGTGVIAISATNSSNTTCGVEINFGDGRVEKKRLEPAEQWQLTHNYKSDGTFALISAGSFVIRGLRSVGPCDIQQNTSVTVANGVITSTAQSNSSPQQAKTSVGQSNSSNSNNTQTPSPGETADIVLFHKKGNSKFQFVTAIDGSKRFTSADILASNGYSLCYAIFPESYKGLGSVEEQQRILDNEVRKNLNNLGGNRAIRSTQENCIRGGQFFGVADVVAVQKNVVSQIKQLNEQYEQFGEVKYDSLAQIASRQQQITSQRSQEVARWTLEINEFSVSGSQDKVASISLLAPQNEREEMKACTIQYTGVQAQAIIGYGSKLVSYLSPTFRLRMIDLRASFNANQPFSNSFRSLDDFYIEFQKNPRICNIFVDYPKNIKTILTSLERDKKIAGVEINALVSSTDAREAWAKSQGYESIASSEFAAQIRANASSIKSLASKGIADKNSYDKVIDELRAARYGDGNSPNEVIAFLDDKAVAEKRGSTAVSIRDDRVNTQRAQSEQRERDEARKRAEYAKEFPFTLTLKCHFRDNIVPMQACMESKAGTKTNLDIRNGSNYGKFQLYDIDSAGERTRAGLVIPLRSQFTLNMQNASETLLLSGSIVSNATQKVVWQESAARFESLRFSNR